MEHAPSIEFERHAAHRITIRMVIVVTPLVRGQRLIVEGVRISALLEPCSALCLPVSVAKNLRSSLGYALSLGGLMCYF